MILVDNLTKSYRSEVGRDYVFKNLSFKIPENKNVALIGKNGSGKSTLMRLLGGVDIPDSGKVLTSKSISWPVGLSGGFQGALSGRQNAKFVCRVYGTENEGIKKKVAFVEEFAEIGKYFDRPMRTYSSGMRARVAFGLSLAFDFDYYLVDEALSVGDTNFRRKAKSALREKVDEANIILVTHGMGQVREFCDVVLLVKKGEVIQYDDVEEGILAYQAE
ncbi:ABC transporter ATP-binding protein [Pusillimonas sp. CC-YST705]|uniref:ABC transporter ATP-binding protein n=1 Tax=Mesopusillimonas faecipullorum TaxID=2755040 RepID=A0ABS8CAG7_9BURK|nr:ABC transporter ATP-binding protein [Mesopusillimonas faecipullorum]MCB5363029.1 ABC transporter ATP-binding protein [Mesopusillimonas faecipullorum]